jgi:hypothetical protein
MTLYSQGTTVCDKTIDHCNKLANSEKNEIKKLENELKYLEELSNTSTYKEDTSLKQKLFVLFFRGQEKSCIFFSFFDPFYSRSDLSPFCFFRVQFI